MSTRDRINDYAETMDKEMRLLEPPEFDEAILGVTCRADGLTVVAYDYMTCIEILMRNGMERDDAEEFMEFNTVSAWLGEGTPIFIDQRLAE